MTSEIKAVEMPPVHERWKQGRKVPPAAQHAVAEQQRRGVGGPLVDVMQLDPLGYREMGLEFPKD